MWGGRGLDDFRVWGPELLEGGVKGAEMGRQWEEVRVGEGLPVTQLRSRKQLDGPVQEGSLGWRGISIYMGLKAMVGDEIT